MRPLRSREAAEARGRLAERLAALLLVVRGYRIEARRFRSPVGEIDIVASRSGLVAFVEVKARAETATALLSLTPRQRVRIARAAEHYLVRRPDLADRDVRFDVVTVSRRWWPRHLPDAWRP